MFWNPIDYLLSSVIRVTSLVSDLLAGLIFKVESPAIAIPLELKLGEQPLIT